MPIDYDPLLAKLIGYGADRASKRSSRLQRALHEYFVGGIKTNISLFRRILATRIFEPAISIPASSTVCWPSRRKASPLTNERGQGVAAIAAGLFAMLDPASVCTNNGTGSDCGCNLPTGN